MIARILIACFCVASLARGATLQERIDAATPGAILEVGSGVYVGPIVVDKPLTLRGHGLPLIEGDGTGNVVWIVSDHVQVEGFRIEGSGLNLSADNAGIFVEGDQAVVRKNIVSRALHGIYVKGGIGARIEGNSIDGLIYIPEDHADVLREGFTSRPTELCTTELDSARRGNGIHLWNSSGHQIVDNVIQHTRDGIYFSFTNQTWVYRNEVSEVRYGLHYMYSDQNTFEENIFSDNAAGAALMYSEQIRAFRNRFLANRGKRAYGILMQSVDSCVFEDNQVLNNTIGWYLENSQNNRFEGNRVERNYVGLRFSASSAGNVFSRNRFRGNLHPVELDQSAGGNRWAIDERGNDWGRSTSPDLDGDGVGEWSHAETDILGKLRREHELVGLLSGSAFLDLLRFASARSRIPGLPRVEDPHPLVSP